MRKPSPDATRYPHPVTDKVNLPDNKKIEKIEACLKEILETLGLDLSDPSLQQTPARVARMYVKELFSGLKAENFPVISYIPDPLQKGDVSQMVFMRVSFTSTCEHHLMPFHGYAYVAYLPHKKLIGLSKIPRLVRYFAKRPQLQERLSLQIADALALLLGHEDVAVSISAQHLCVIARGVEDDHSSTTTHVFKGVFGKRGPLREEFFASVK
jgi:GTP cyclohydrolase I